jgi:acetylornithine deacetylase
LILFQPVDSIAALLKSMVAFDTVNAHVSGRPHPERPLADFLADLAASWGLQVLPLPIGDGGINLLVQLPPEDGKPWLLFQSHMDTVGVEGMTGPVFNAEIRGSRMHGRGTADTKGSGAAMLWTLKTLLQSPRPRPNNIALLFTVGEEVGKLGARTFAENQLPSLGWSPFLTLVGEPTLLRPVFAHNGVARVAIETRGLAAHSSSPELGRSAIRAMARLVLHLEDHFIPSLQAAHPLTGRARASINLIRGGQQINIIPDRCVAEMDRRIVPGEEIASVIPALESAIVDFLRHSPEFEASVVQAPPPYLDGPLETRRPDETRAFLSPVLAAHHIDHSPIGVPYGTDASLLHAAGLNCIVVGPGDIAQAHTADEWIELDQLDLAAALFLDLATTPAP